MTYREPVLLPVRIGEALIAIYSPKHIKNPELLPDLDLLKLYQQPLAPLRAYHRLRHLSPNTPAYIVHKKLLAPVVADFVFLLKAVCAYDFNFAYYYDSSIKRFAGILLNTTCTELCSIFDLPPVQPEELNDYALCDRPELHTLVSEQIAQKKVGQGLKPDAKDLFGDFMVFHTEFHRYLFKYISLISRLNGIRGTKYDENLCFLHYLHVVPQTRRYKHPPLTPDQLMQHFQRIYRIRPVKIKRTKETAARETIVLLLP